MTEQQIAHVILFSKKEEVKNQLERVVNSFQALLDIVGNENYDQLCTSSIQANINELISLECKITGMNTAKKVTEIFIKNN